MKIEMDGKIVDTDDLRENGKCSVTDGTIRKRLNEGNGVYWSVYSPLVNGAKYKLGIAEWKTIQIMYASGNHSQYDLAKMYNVSQSTISAIISRKLDD